MFLPTALFSGSLPSSRLGDLADSLLGMRIEWVESSMTSYSFVVRLPQLCGPDGDTPVSLPYSKSPTRLGFPAWRSAIEPRERTAARATTVSPTVDSSHLVCASLRHVLFLTWPLSVRRCVHSIRKRDAWICGATLGCLLLSSPLGCESRADWAAISKENWETISGGR